MWDVISNEFTAGFSDPGTFTRIVVRLLAAALCGFAIGYEREKTGHAAGLRTHMLVCLGTAIFVIAGEISSFTSADLSRVVQGIITGIGFLGAGSILKLSESHQIRGLTTAAGLWVTTGIGVFIGLGRVGVALLCVVLALVILQVVHRFERSWPTNHTNEQKP